MRKEWKKKWRRSWRKGCERIRSKGWKENGMRNPCSKSENLHEGFQPAETRPDSLSPFRKDGKEQLVQFISWIRSRIHFSFIFLPFSPLLSSHISRPSSDRVIKRFPASEFLPPWPCPLDLTRSTGPLFTR
ncbi:hypothetical protein IE53DRAFT_277394 [Violaceomyces palustris]|uniref:Uncharacterized protein n=1 Tax=Violaceomyces palustris TaxID=1673888 RepID=A0ACD0NMF3_9BASI|nr:hypothetical protein IE53DRAFT_277394 [Violaceomyces palustris]